MDNRRQSGLWSRNPQTGFYEQVAPPSQAAPAGPYQYYQPPPRAATHDKGRSFSERAAVSGDAEGGNMLRSDSKTQHPAVLAVAHAAAGPINEFMANYPDSTSEHLAQTQHINSTSLPGSSHQEPLDADSEFVPANLRSKAWSPVPASQLPRQVAQPKVRGVQNASNTSAVIRRDSVPHRSPLQNLEAWSKEEKRARVQKAEDRARQRSATESVDRSSLRPGTASKGKNKTLSDDMVHHSHQQEPGQSTELPSSEDALMNSASGNDRFQDAAKHLKLETTSARQSPPRSQGHAVSKTGESKRKRGAPVANQTQPYRRASPVSRAADTAEWPSRNAIRDPDRPVDIAKESRPHHHAPSTPRDADTADWSSSVIQNDTQTSRHADENAQQHLHDAETHQDTNSSGLSPRRNSPRMSADLSRTQGKDYRNRARNTGFTGALAAASAGAGIVGANSAAQRGKAAYERRKSQNRDSRYADSNIDRPGSADSDHQGVKQPDVSASAARDSFERLEEDHNDRAGSRQQRYSFVADDEHDSFTHDRTGHVRKEPVRFADPPQAAASEQVIEQRRRSRTEGNDHHAASLGEQHHFHNWFQHDRSARRSYQSTIEPLEEWRQAEVAKLTLRDLEFEDTVAASTAKSTLPTEDKSAAWWEKGRRRASSSVPAPAVDLSQYDGPYREHANGFQPRLFLRCGPLLRYTGIRKETTSRPQSGRPADREIWRGSIMIVTEDSQSDFSSTPRLQLFAQPMDLLPTPRHPFDKEHEAQPEHEDPVAGQLKLSRTGRALYARPVNDIEGGVDLSQQENPRGLFTAIHAPALGSRPPARSHEQHDPYAVGETISRVRNRDGEKAGRVREVKATRLHTERGWTFWRFNLEVELGNKQYRVAYRINSGPAMAFWVPPKGETMNIMFHSCNGFSRATDPAQFSGPDPLWRDVLNRHQSRPFHVMIGGGDQIYNDVVADEALLFNEWLLTKNTTHKYKAEFTAEMQDELEDFYRERYAMWFSQGLFAMANSQIPMVNIWDDHDIIDGFGSYPHHFMNTLVFSGLGAVAHKYYMLFQHQSLVTETAQSEPSWVLGETPGPYIHEVSRSVFLHLGSKTAFLGLDCRTERMWDEILSQRTYDLVFARCRREIVKGETNHLIVLLGVPIAYPRLNFLENILTSRAMEPIKALGRTGVLGGFVNKFDGGVEILDDLNDHWTAKHHKAERNWFVQELQELAAEKSVRITILGGDVHLGAAGKFYTASKSFVSKDQDHRYMPNIISSAIVNTPPPNMMADVLNRRNKVHHLDDQTDEDMIPMFTHDVDGSKRNNARLMPRRNYCTIHEYNPGSTPPSTPPQVRATPAPLAVDVDGENESNDRRFPPRSITRTMSLTRGTANLVRRLSASSRTRRPPVSLQSSKPYGALGQSSQPDQGAPQRANSMGGPRPDAPQQDRPVHTFHRRPTDLSVKAARKAAAKGSFDGAPDGRELGHIDLEGGLDISLNVEVDPHDPSGATIPYRLLVPALWYDGPAHPHPKRFESRRVSLMNRLKGFRRREMPADGAADAENYSDDDSRTPSPLPTEQRSAATPPPEQAMGLTSTGRGAVKAAHRSHKLSTHESDGHNAASVPDPTSAYDQGFNLASPPMGMTQLPPSQQGLGRSASVRQRSQAMPGVARAGGNEHLQRSHQRHVSAPEAIRSPPAHARAGTHRNDYDEDDDDEHMNNDDDPHGEISEDEDDVSQDSLNVQSTRRHAEKALPVRRGSKAERFLGIGEGDADGPWAGTNGTRRASVHFESDAAERPALLGRNQGSLRRKIGWKGWKS